MKQSVVSNILKHYKEEHSSRRKYFLNRDHNEIKNTRNNKFDFIRGYIELIASLKTWLENLIGPWLMG